METEKMEEIEFPAIDRAKKLMLERRRREREGNDSSKDKENNDNNDNNRILNDDDNNNTRNNDKSIVNLKQIENINIKRHEKVYKNPTVRAMEKDEDFSNNSFQSVYSMRTPQNLPQNLLQSETPAVDNDYYQIANDFDQFITEERKLAKDIFHEALNSHSKFVDNICDLKEKAADFCNFVSDRINEKCEQIPPDIEDEHLDIITTTETATNANTIKTAVSNDGNHHTVSSIPYDYSSNGINDEDVEDLKYSKDRLLKNVDEMCIAMEKVKNMGFHGQNNLEKSKNDENVKVKFPSNNLLPDNLCIQSNQNNCDESYNTTAKIESNSVQLSNVQLEMASEASIQTISETEKLVEIKSRKFSNLSSLAEKVKNQFNHSHKKISFEMLCLRFIIRTTLREILFDLWRYAKATVLYETKFLRKCISKWNTNIYTQRDIIGRWKAEIYRRSSIIAKDQAWDRQFDGFNATEVIKEEGWSGMVKLYRNWRLKCILFSSWIRFMADK